MKTVLEKILAIYAKLTLRINHPKIVGITGSVGKSSTKDAVALVLAEKFHVRANPGNLNSQLGLPLAVLGFRHPGGFHKDLTSALRWLGIIVVGFFRIFTFNFPEILVLEMGSDRPGDLSYLLSITGELEAAVITYIGVSHLENYPNAEALKREKLSLLRGLRKSGFMVLNADNPKVMEGRNNSIRSIVYGLSNADVTATDIQMTQKNGNQGTGFKVNYSGNRVPVFIPNSIGKPNVYASLAAISVGLGFGMNLVEITQALEKFAAPAGRLKIIPGINQTTIIDDTYNAAPASTIAALEVLQNMPTTRKLVVIGSMAELGSANDSGHREVAAKISEVNPSLVFLVGENAKIIEDELHKRSFAEKISWYENSDAAKAAVRASLLPGDVVLVKGSQSARMEKVVAAIMQEPQKAKDLLARQSKQWLK